MSDVAIYHNPRCRKCREAMAILDEKKANYKVVEYLNDNPSLEDIKAIHKKLNVPVIDMIRTAEPEFKELGLNKNDDDETLLKAIAKAPKLLQRPIIIKGNKAVIARPPELANDVL